jgi:sigma-B regulation protein RsbU (phosphoserine phosphatase)
MPFFSGVKTVLRNKGIAFKLILFYTLSGAIVFLLIFGFNYYFSRKMIEKNVEDNARNLALSKVNRIETVLLAVQKIPENLACYLENSAYTKEELVRMLRAVVQNNPEIYGAAVAFEPYGFDKTVLHFAPYFFKSDGSIEFSDLGKGSYRYDSWDWYQIPKELNASSWSEPYYDEGGGYIIMATYSVPLYKKIGGKKHFAGIVTADINLGWLQEVVSSTKVLQTGYAFLISQNGTIVTHPSKDLIMNETIFGVAEARNDSQLRDIGKKMIGGESGLVPFRSIDSEKPCWMYYTPIPSNGWSLAVLFPRDELAADVTRLNGIVVVLGVVGLLLLSVAIVFIARSITNPLRAMAEASKTIATGNLEVELPPVKSGDEVGKLSDAFRYMKESLKKYIHDLTETTAAKERIESELKIAHDIQMSILPKTFPPFPDRREFDIYAAIEPAREVGGDFYDFFFIDDDCLCFVIGDVSGKGVPAALFMAVTKTLIKAKTSRDGDPGMILTKINKDLNQGNEASMFVTIFIGILNTKTGEIFYSNGGHNPPLLIRREADVSLAVEPLPTSPGLVVGAMEESTYQTERITLNPGDAIFVYTDGVTEAMNERGAFFSDGRLKKQLVTLKGKSVRETLAETMEGIASFSHGASQSDDITMMMIRFNGGRA